MFRSGKSGSWLPVTAACAALLSAAASAPAPQAEFNNPNFTGCIDRLP